MAYVVYIRASDGTLRGRYTMMFAVPPCVGDHIYVSGVLMKVFVRAIGWPKVDLIVEPENHNPFTGQSVSNPE